MLFENGSCVIHGRWPSLYWVIKTNLLFENIENVFCFSFGFIKSVFSRFLTSDWRFNILIEVEVSPSKFFAYFKFELCILELVVLLLFHYAAGRVLHLVEGWLLLNLHLLIFFEFSFCFETAELLLYQATSVGLHSANFKALWFNVSHIKGHSSVRLWLYQLVVAQLLVNFNKCWAFAKCSKVLASWVLAVLVLARLIRSRGKKLTDTSKLSCSGGQIVWIDSRMMASSLPVTVGTRAQVFVEDILKITGATRSARQIATDGVLTAWFDRHRVNIVLVDLEASFEVQLYWLVSSWIYPLASLPGAGIKRIFFICHVICLSTKVGIPLRVTFKRHKIAGGALALGSLGLLFLYDLASALTCTCLVGCVFRHPPIIWRCQLRNWS